MSEVVKAYVSSSTMYNPFPSTSMLFENTWRARPGPKVLRPSSALRK